MERNIAALLDVNAFTIKVMFKESVSDKPKEYTYVCNIPGVKVGDWVVVDAPDFNNYSSPVSIDDMQTIETLMTFTGVPKTVIVTGVDKTVNIEPNSSIKYKWVVCKVDTAGYTATAKRNAEVTSLVTKAYTQNLRRSFADRILADMSEADKTKLLTVMAPPAPTRRAARKPK